jgi:hypothetical protein
MDAAGLPHLDEHSIEVDADAGVVWASLSAHIERSFAGRATEGYTRLVGCEDVVPAGPRPLAEGSVVVGFHVVSADPPNELVLRGRHRFSDYALIVRIDRLGPQRSRLRAETRAAFPGALGRVYKAAAIGTRGHAIVVRRMLAAIARRSVREPGTV